MSVNGANQVITAKFTAIQALEKAGDKKGAEALRQQLLDFGFTKDQIDEGILNLGKGPEGTAEQRAARGAANQGAVDEVSSDETTITSPTTSTSSRFWSKSSSSSSNASRLES